MRKFITISGIIAGTLGVAMGAAFAISNSATVSGTTNKTVYSAGRDVVITGTVNGDVFCAGQTVNVDATVNGDVICAGQTVTVDGTVNGSVRLAGQTVNLGASVSRAASLAGQDITVQNNARVGNDLTLAGQTVIVDGRIGRDINGATRALTLTNSVGRNVDVRVAKLELQKPAVITGNLDYTAPKASDLHSGTGSQVLGSRSFHVAPASKHKMHWGSWLAWHVYLGLALTVLSLVLVAAFPRAFHRWNRVAEQRLWTALLVGFLASIMAPVAIIAMFITMVGAPLAILATLAWWLTIVLSAPLAAYYVGSRILPREKRIPLVMLVGAIGLAIVCQLPFIGWAIALVAFWLGAGIALLNLRAHLVRPNYRRP